jgi:hypothetical protein
MLWAALAVVAVLHPASSPAQNLFEFLFGALQKQQQSPAAAPPSSRTTASGGGPAFCVRTCDGKYFPLMRGAASPSKLCQAFCPATPIKVFFGSGIDSARTANGERYADSENAYAYRTALRADCTCNGSTPGGLAPVDLALDTQLRTGDLVATEDGTAAYSGIRLGVGQTPDLVRSLPVSAEAQARSGR